MKLFAGFGNRHVYLALALHVVQVAIRPTRCSGRKNLRPGSLLAWTVLFFFLASDRPRLRGAVDNLLAECAHGDAGGRSPCSSRARDHGHGRAPAPCRAQSLAQLIEEKEKAPFLNDFHRILFRFSVSAGWALCWLRSTR